MSVDKTELLKRAASEQLAGIREYVFACGKAQSTGVYEVYNAAGLRFSVLKDMCLDLYDFSYKGVNISFQAKNGLVNNRFFNALENEFVYYWRGGMLYTCGLANVGPACTDNGYYRTTHGRIGMTPAENASARTQWANGDYRMSVEGEMHESMLYGSDLVLKRRIETGLYSKEITITDILENREPLEEEFMILYHFNFGYPLLDEGTEIKKTKAGVTPRTPEAERGMDFWQVMTAPLDNEPEQVFFHENRQDLDGYTYAGVINKKIGLGAYLKYRQENLPVLTEWKSMRAHDYALGLEPTNSFVNGRKRERENGTLKKIEGYGRQKFEISLGILDGEAEITEFENMVDSL